MPVSRSWYAAIVASVTLHGAVLGLVLITHDDADPVAAAPSALGVELVMEPPTAAAAIEASPVPAPIPEPSSPAQVPPVEPAPLIVTAQPPLPLPGEAKDDRVHAHRVEKKRAAIDAKPGRAQEVTANIDFAPTPRHEPAPSAVAETTTGLASASQTPQHETTVSPAAAPSTGAVSGIVDAPASAIAAASASAASTAPATSLDADYLRTVLAWLEQHKAYPEQARMEREEGTVLIAFGVDRHGHVVSFAVRKSSGFAVLDMAAKDMIDRSDPMPPIPASYARDRLVLTLPVEFNLR